jgi:hypothetical protein
MRLQINWLWNWLWRRGTPSVALAGGGNISYPVVAMMAPDEPTSAETNESADQREEAASSPPPPVDEAETVEVEEEEEQDQSQEEEDSPTESSAFAWDVRSLPVELRFLYDLIQYRILEAFHPDSANVRPTIPFYEDWELPIGKFIIGYNMANPRLTIQETIVLLIAVAEHVRPDLFDHAIHHVLDGKSDFLLMGGVRGKNFRGFIPTGQTAVFLLAGANWEKDLHCQQLFWADRFFAKNKILWLGEVEEGEPVLSGKIILSQDYVDILVHDKVLAPHHNINFPAKLVSTPKVRSQLVINDELKKGFDHVIDWINHKAEVEKSWGEGKKGYRCLFHGPSGTGKTFATCILGKETHREVYRIDLSLVVSKFIGETEKNLELIFARAENKDWILFFDEADALFGKRTNIRDAHDKYANQEASYLLQRIEDYDGLVVLATNMKNNIDESFLRRFDSDLKFSMPGMEERKKIWQSSFPKDIQFGKEPVIVSTEAEGAQRPDQPGRKFYKYHRRKNEQELVSDEKESKETKEVKAPPPDIPDLVKCHALSGANIQNVVHYATIRAAKRKADEMEKRKKAAGDVPVEQPEPPLVIYLEDVQDGVKRELSKNGIPLTDKKRKSWDSRLPV